MSELLAQLGDLLSYFLKVVPRLWIVEPDEGGVRTTLGTRIKPTPPGWYIYWPLIQVCEGIKTKVQVKDVRIQSVWTKDGVEIAMSVGIRYSVANARLAILNCFDYDANIQVIALGLMTSAVSNLKLEELMDPETRRVLCESVFMGVKEKSRGWGLKIEEIVITDIGKTRNFRLLFDRGINI